MEICSICGHKNTDNSRFCQECGNPYPSKTTKKELNSKEATLEPTQAAPNTRTKMKKKNKLIVSIIITLAVIFIGAHLFIQQSIDPYKQLSNADRAFAMKDSDAFLSYFSTQEDVLADHESFYKFMKEEDWTNSISPSIKEMIRSVEQGTYLSPIQDREGNNLISVIDEKYLLFYKKIKVQLEPIKVKATSSVPNTEVTLSNDATITLAEGSDTVLGNFTPGIHTFNVLVTDDSSEQTYERQNTIIGDGSNEHELFFDFSDQTINITSDYDDAIIWLNGKSTKKTADQLNLYNVPRDGTVKLQAVANVDGGEKKSETVAVEDTQIHLAFADVQEKIQAEEVAKEKKQAMEDFTYEYEDYARQLFYDFRSDYAYALMYGDFSYVSDYFADGTKLKDDYREFVIDHNDFDFSYQYDFISNDISSIEAINENTFNLYSYEVFDFFTSTDDNWHYERQKKYTLKLISGQLKITGLDDSAKVKKTKITD